MPPTRRSAAAKTFPVKAAAAEVVRPFMSEGMRVELVTHGRAIDPATGGTFERDEDTGRVTYTDRDGKTVEL